MLSDTILNLATTLTPESVEAISGAGDALVSTGATLLPPPWDAIVGIFGGLFLGLFRARQNREAAKNIVRAIDLAKTPEGRVDFKDSATLGKIRAVADKRAQTIVDEAQGKRKPKPF